MVQRAVRAWLLRRGLERFTERRRRGVAAVVRLQALWRTRQPRQQYQALRQAAITVQVGWVWPLSEVDVCMDVVHRDKGSWHPAELNVAHMSGPQAAYRGKLARRAVFHTLVVPRMLEAGLRRKRQVEASRWVAQAAI